MPTTTPLIVTDLGHKSYAEVWELQKRMQRALIDGHSVDTLLTVEHEPVITLGRSTKPDSLLTSRELIQSRGIGVFDVERGGDVTYHGPGQLVVYPIINLTLKKQDVHWYMRSLEEVVIRTLARWEVVGERIVGKTGVWVKQHDDSYAKISSIGVRISHWCTMHGLALNVQNCSNGFSVMNPCGMAGIRVTSLAEELYNRGSSTRSPNFETIKADVIRTFCTVFDYEQTAS